MTTIDCARLCLHGCSFLGDLRLGLVTTHLSRAVGSRRFTVQQLSGDSRSGVTVTVRPCPVCGRQTARLLYRPAAAPGPVSECCGCSMVYVAEVTDNRALIVEGPVVPEGVDPRILTSSNLDDVRNSWEFELLPLKEAEWPAVRRNAAHALRRLDKHARLGPSDRRILDFGSAWGFFLAVAKEHGWEAYGLEPLPASAVYARAKFGVTVKADTLREDTFPAQFFDAITAFQVFEHLPNPAGDLALLRRMLRNGGILLIEVPNIRTWSVRVLRSRHRHFVQDHLNFFSAETLRRLLTETGFEVVDEYCPTRRMTVRYLIECWAARCLPALVPVLRSIAKRAGAWDRVVAINIGDIVAVIARKLE